MNEGRKEGRKEDEGKRGRTGKEGRREQSPIVSNE